jgi:hypothetical protein
MQLYDPTSSGPERHLARAAAMASLEGKTIGILENGKLNAPEMLQAVADLFVQRHGCIVHAMYSKSNASAPAPAEILAQAVREVDFLITGLGD